MRTFTGQFSPRNPVDYTPLTPEAQLLDKVDKPDDFSEKRWRCIYRPERALDTLSACAILEIGILSGRDLVEREPSLLKAIDTTADAAVQVYLDDQKQEKCRTVFARGRQDPIWKCHCEVEVLAPMSMIRLQVVDDQPAEQVQIGFVEFCVGDLPYDTAIEGWFELRFQDNMKRTSVERYFHHSRMREEVKSQVATKEAAELADKKKKLEQEGPQKSMAPQQDGEAQKAKYTKKEVFAKTKTRAVGAFDACIQSTADKAQELGFDTLSKSLQDGRRAKERNNAGELYISLRLRKVVSGMDSLFAFALNPPPPVNSGAVFEMDTDEQVDVQLVWDSIWDAKVKLVDDAILCFSYWFKYMVYWRSSLLSFIYLVGFLMICWHSFTTWAIAPLLASTSLIVNYFPAARMYMTRGGHNSPLTEDGFQWTASWRSTDEMLAFVTRLVQDDVKGKVTDSQKLWLFAARCMREGAPTVSLDDLRAALKVAPFINMDAAQDLVVTTDDIVWVDGRDPAKVLRSGPGPEEITVCYEAVSAPQPVVVQSRRVTPRTILSGGQSRLLSFFPSALERALNEIYPIIEDVKEAALPAVLSLTKLLIWSNFGTTLGLVILMLLISAMFSWAAVTAFLGRVSQTGSLDGPREIIVLILRNIDNAIVTVLTIVVLVTKSWWFASTRSVLKILSRCGHRRTAPSYWAFFKEDKEHKTVLANLAAQAARENPLGMFHLPYMTTDTSASYAAAATSTSSLV